MERNDDDGDLGSGSREPRLAFPQVGKEPLLLPQRRSPGSMRPWDTAPLRMRRRGGVGEAEGGSPISTAPHVGVGVVATCGNRRETRLHADGATPGRVLRVIGPGQLSVWGLPWVPRAEFDGSQRLPEDNPAQMERHLCSEYTRWSRCGASRLGDGSPSPTLPRWPVFCPRLSLGGSGHRTPASDLFPPCSADFSRPRSGDHLEG